MKSQRLLQGAGVAALVLFPIYANVIDGPSSLRMHSPTPLTIYIFSILANLVTVSIVFGLIGRWILRSSRWSWLKVLLPGLVLASVAELIYITRRGHQSIALWFWVLVAFSILAIILHWTWARGENILLRLCGATLMGFGFYCCFVVLQLLYLASWRPLPNIARAGTNSASSRPGGPRVVWILFDELSQDQVFGHRYAGLKLPNFDRFRRSSTLFTNVQPAVNETEEAIPSILLGKNVTRVDFSYGNRLQIGVGKHALQPFAIANTPFALARSKGLTTGIAGWYNPYCGTLAPHANDCFWTDEMLMPAVFENEGFWGDFFGAWARYYDRISRHNRGSQAVEARIGAYLELMRAADRLLQPAGPDLVLIHLPLPHPPGFYNRATGQMDGSGSRSYIDNLALADKTLGQLLTILESSPRWEQTNVLICGDHSWRVYMWSHMHFWTTEDQVASQSQTFDPRPALMVHLAGQTKPETVTAPFPLLRVHNILDDLIEGRQPAYASLLKAESLAGQ